MHLLGELLPKHTCLLQSVQSFRVHSIRLQHHSQGLSLSFRSKAWTGRCYAATAAPEAPPKQSQGKAKGGKPAKQAMFRPASHPTAP